jgi:peptidoglycan/xylan/chitin deacetylase (PgdA/CDA1 family)
MHEIYLTIDDTPSPLTDDLVDGLVARGVPALLFCRGDFLDASPDAAYRAIDKGMVLGNHGYEH